MVQCRGFLRPSPPSDLLIPVPYPPPPPHPEPLNRLTRITQFFGRVAGVQSEPLSPGNGERNHAVRMPPRTPLKEIAPLTVSSPGVANMGSRDSKVCILRAKCS